MKKVVTSKTLAGSLPREVRGDIDPGHTVRVTVEEVSAPATTKGHFSRHFGLHRRHFASMDEIVAHVRAVRDGDEQAGS